MFHRVETIEYTDTEVRCYTDVIPQLLVTMIIIQLHLTGWYLPVLFSV